MYLRYSTDKIYRVKVHFDKFQLTKTPSPLSESLNIGNVIYKKIYLAQANVSS